MAWVAVGVGAATLVVGYINSQNQADAAQAAGNSQYAATLAGIDATQQASAEGQTYLTPYRQLGDTGIDKASFLTDPNEQFQYLKDNPLFDLALNNANEQTLNLSAARGRLSSGDTLQQLSNNVLLSGAPLIQSQKQSINDLLNLGSGTARAQANTAIGAGSQVSDLLTQGGNARAAGIIGAGNANAAFNSEVANVAGSVVPAIINRNQAAGNV